MREPTMKQLWAGLAMFALIVRDYEGSEKDIALEAWRMADMMDALELDEDRDDEDFL